MKYEYKAVIHMVPDKGGAYVEFPYDVRKEFGKGRAKVHVTFDDIPYDGSVVNMGVKNPDGSICYIIGMLKSIREKLGKGEGDTVLVTVCHQEEANHGRYNEPGADGKDIYEINARVKEHIKDIKKSE